MRSRPGRALKTSAPGTVHAYIARRHAFVPAKLRIAGPLAIGGTWRRGWLSYVPFGRTGVVGALLLCRSRTLAFGSPMMRSDSTVFNTYRFEGTASTDPCR